MVGLTGNYGMGKSFVLSVFRDLGAYTLSSDEIVGSLLKKRKVIIKLVKILGEGIIGGGGRLDRGKIADIIFKDEKLRRKTEAVLHPLVFKKIDDVLKKIRNRKCIVVIEVPLLFEGRHRNRFDRVITVCTTMREALKRLAKAGIPGREALRRMKTQMPIRDKKKFADYVVDNNGPKRKTKKRVESIYKTLLREQAD